MRFDSAPIELVPGTRTTITLPEEIASVSDASTSADGFSVAVYNGNIALAASVWASIGSVAVQIQATGCVDVGCGARLVIQAQVRVRPIGAPRAPLYGFAEVSPDRVAAGTALPGGGVALNDELVITVGDDDEPLGRAAAEQAAAVSGSVLAGGIDDLGVYQLRWTPPQDLDARRTQLLAVDGVEGVTRSRVGEIATNGDPPGDWDDDGPAVTWPFRQIRAQAAWDVTTGSDTKVGIVDEGTVEDRHEDLEVKLFGVRSPGEHATHVGGLACAKGNGVGVVGVAWGCPLASAAAPDASDLSVLTAATAVAMEPGVRVANISMGINVLGTATNRCGTAADQAAAVTAAQATASWFYRLFTSSYGTKILWVVSAGNNCADGVSSAWGQNFDLENVITVAATNSDDTLASFSNFGTGVEVAAPGGVGIGNDGNGLTGLWSTVTGSCGIFRWSTCKGYGTSYGTSMAAPVVAGIAALVRSKHPSYGAAAAGRCIVGTALGNRYVRSRSSAPTHGLRTIPFSPQVTFVANTLPPIVDAAAAVKCDAPKVRALTTTTGPVGFAPGVTGPACKPPSGGFPSMVTIYDDHTGGREAGGEYIFGHDGWEDTLGFTYHQPAGTHRATFTCRDGIGGPTVWTDPGIEFTLTGTARPTKAAIVDGSVSFQSGGTSDPCPAIRGLTPNHVQLATQLGAASVVRYLEWPVAATETVALPASARSGDSIYAYTQCYYSDTAGHDARFDYALTSIKVPGPSNAGVYADEPWDPSACLPFDAARGTVRVSRATCRAWSRPIASGE